MNEEGQNIDFTVDQTNLYREESYTDLKVASIRKLVPIRADGSEDTERQPVFLGHTQLMSPEGPVPLQAKLEGGSLEEAMAAFPAAMQQALAEMMEQVRQMQRQQQNQQRDDSRIIIPR